MLHEVLPMFLQHRQELIKGFNTRSPEDCLTLTERLAGEPLLSRFPQLLGLMV